MNSIPSAPELFNAEIAATIAKFTEATRTLHGIVVADRKARRIPHTPDWNGMRQSDLDTTFAPALLTAAMTLTVLYDYLGS